jgi:hypothetical protein
MSITVTESSTEALQRLFLVPDVPLGQTWLTLAKQPVLTDTLHGLVLDSKIPSTVKARSM